MKEAWELKKLGEVLTIERGGSPRPIKKYLTDSSEGINWIKISDATASNKYIYETKEKITKDGLHKTRLVNEGDFLLSNSMSFGRPYIMKTTGCIHDGWLVLKQDEKKVFETEYLYYLLFFALLIRAI
jgi:type I restriction enzyme S subunit